MAELTADQKKSLANTMSTRVAIGAVGLLGAIYLAHKEKKGAWGYVGYIVLGSLAAGAVAYLVTFPAQKKLIMSQA